MTTDGDVGGGDGGVESGRSCLVFEARLIAKSTATMKRAILGPILLCFTWAMRSALCSIPPNRLLVVSSTSTSEYSRSALSLSEMSASRSRSHLRKSSVRSSVSLTARGQQRSLMSSVTEYPQVSISTGQCLDRCPIFQAGHAGSIPVAFSARDPLTFRTRLYRWRGAARGTAFVRGRGRPRLPAC
jgi:hypothetical protein